MSTYPLSETAIRALANDKSYDRGYRYYQDDAVFDIVRRGQMVTAAVQGSDYEPYRLQVTFDDSGVADLMCTCPYDWGGICKHLVALLLTLLHDADLVTERPSLAEQLAGLSAEQLRDLLLGIASYDPTLITKIESELSWLSDDGGADAAGADAAGQVDLRAVRRDIHNAFRRESGGNRYDDYYHDYDALEIDVSDILAPHLQQVGDQLDAGEWKTAVALIRTIMESYAGAVAGLDEWVLDYNMDAIDMANLEAGAVLVEVLLSRALAADGLAADSRRQWLQLIDQWETDLGDLEIARTAVDHGWDYAPLAAALAGHISEQGAWEGEVPDFADELARARLRILARRDRRQAYVNLALAEGQTALALIMRVQMGDVDTAVAEAKQYLGLPTEVLAVAKALAVAGEQAAALDVAGHGLTLEYPYGAAELAQWTRTQAQATGDQALALRAAQAAFRATISLETYTAVQQIAGEKWPTIKPELLAHIEQVGFVYPGAKVDIYLHEGLLAEAMATVNEKPAYVDEAIVGRVVAATRVDYPDWGIGIYQQRAEAIMNAGQAQAYDTAAYYLSQARDIYRQHDRLPAWRRYLDGLLEMHRRKYKLVPLLRELA